MAQRSNKARAARRGILGKGFSVGQRDLASACAFLPKLENSEGRTESMSVAVGGSPLACRPPPPRLAAPFRNFDTEK
jgi:hypothetical protein